jgi:menaquinol-cytochrome c reductase cytochrome b/c subunit
VNQREKEAYLREYAVLKSKGKPFFPYAVAKDSIMAAIVVLVIILMSLTFGGVPTICMILLFTLPFVDKGPERRPERRPIATTAGILTIFAMGYLTYLGASAGSPNEIDMATNPKYEAGKLVVAQSGCLACHKIGENGNSGPGPQLTHIGDRLRPQAIERTLNNPTAPMPSFRNLPAEKKSQLVAFLASLKDDAPDAPEYRPAPSPQTASSGG